MLGVLPRKSIGRPAPDRMSLKGRKVPERPRIFYGGKGPHCVDIKGGTNRRRLQLEIWARVKGPSRGEKGGTYQGKKWGDETREKKKPDGNGGRGFN